MPATPQRQAAPPIPVTVIGGYLGAGKTTLVNHLLRHANGVRIAVLVNDFGALQIDAELIAAADGDTVSLTNGCICCSLAGGMMEALQAVAARPQPPERVVIETSGVSDPVAVAQYAHLPGFRLDAVIVLADAETVRRRSTDRHVGRHVLQQLRGADLLVLNKVDLVDPERLAAVRTWLSEAATGVRVIHAVNAHVPMAVLFDTGHQRELSQHHDAAARVEHRSWTFVDDRPVDRAAFDQWVETLPPSIVRAKGFVEFIDQPGVQWEFQLVGARHRLTRREGDARGGTRVVLIGLPADGAEPESPSLRSWRAGIAAAPTEELSS